MKVLVVGAGLAGLAATERLLDDGASVVVVEAFPLPGGRTASFDVTTNVAGLVPGDVVEHGLHAWFQHYHALFGLMERAGLAKPPLSGRGVHLWNPRDGHQVISGGPLLWLVNALRLPEHVRGPRSSALAAFGRLIADLGRALANPEETDRESAGDLLSRFGVPAEALENVFAPCLYSLTSLPLSELSALEMLRWMSNILPDPRIRSVEGGCTPAMTAPIVRYLSERGADFRFGVEVEHLSLAPSGRVQIELIQAPDRTGVRHVLVPGFRPAEVPDASAFDAVLCTLPWERLVRVSRGDPRLLGETAGADPKDLRNLHPLTVRLWFERPIEHAETSYILSSGTLFDVLRPTPERTRYGGTHLVDLLVENVETHLPKLGYDRERLVEGPAADDVVRQIVVDLERLYPGQVNGNPVARKFLHTREGIIACRPGAWSKRAPQFIGLRNFVLGGDWTQQPWGVCMEGAVRSGQLAVEALLAGKQPRPSPHPFGELAHSVRSFFETA